MTADRKLILAAAHLARRAPTEWAEFVSAFHAHYDQRRDECVQSPPTTLPVAQGRAQACAYLRNTFAECLEQASKIEQMPRSPRKP